MVAKRIIQITLPLLLIVAAVPSRVSTAPAGTPAVDWVVGDVFVAIGNGSYNVYDVNQGYKLVQTASDGSTNGATTAGCAFDSGYRFFGTNFSNTRVDRYSINLDTSVFNNTGLVQSISTGTGTPQSTHPESIAFAGGSESFFVGHADNGSGGFGSGTIEQWSLNPSTGSFALTNTFPVVTENRGADWIDLANNNTTLFYTSEGRLIKRFDTAQGQLSDFANLGSAGGSQVTLFALKIVPTGPFAGDVLAADKKNIKLVNSSSSVVKTYDAPGQDDWEALSLDPNGTSFWAGDATTHNFYRFNISSGAIEVSTDNQGHQLNSGSALGGICVDGAFSAAQPAPTTFAPVTLTPGPDNTATACFPAGCGTAGTTIWTVTLVNMVKNSSITLTARKSLVDPSVALSDPLIFQQSPGSPSGTTAGGNLACDQTFTPGSCEVFEIEANPNSGYDFADYAVGDLQSDTTPNLRLLRNHDQDITTSVKDYPLSGTKSKCVLTVNGQTSTPGAQSCGFSSLVSGQVFNQGKSIPFKFQAAPSATACASNGPFLTNLKPLLLIVPLPPTATPQILTPAPLPVMVQVAGSSGGPPIFTLGGTGSSGNNTTYQLQVKTTNMPVGNYRATVIDLNNVIPSFGVDFSLQ